MVLFNFLPFCLGSNILVVIVAVFIISSLFSQDKFMGSPFIIMEFPLLLVNFVCLFGVVSLIYLFLSYIVIMGIIPFFSFSFVITMRL